MNIRRKFFALIWLGYVLSTASALSADPLNLESGLPLQVEDAYVTPFQNREYHGFLRYDRGDEDEDSLDVVQRVELGIWYNTELTIEAPFVFGEDVEDGYGDTAVEVLYNINQETRTLPAFSVGTTIVSPTGQESHGVDPEVEAIFTKTLPGTWELHRVHLNGGYRFNDDIQPRERAGVYSITAGYEVRATNQLIVLADVVREQELTRGLETNVVEAGFRYALTPYSVASFGVGTGFGARSPEFVSTFGIQVVFF